MCRNIRPLFNFDPPASQEEIHEAATQYVRKISGFRVPSRANQAAFDAAVEDIARISGRLLATLETTAAPKNRQVEAAKVQARRSRQFPERIDHE
jgi:hypothetical protein